jgi:hypothetical protein
VAALLCGLLPTAGCPEEGDPGSSEETIAPGWVASRPAPDILSLQDVVVLDESLVYAVGTDARLLRYEDGTWAPEETPAEISRDTIFESVSGVYNPETGEELVMAVGSNGTVVTRTPDDGWVVWQTQFPELHYFGVWVRALDDAFIVGDEGRILRWDGTVAQWMESESQQSRQILDANGNMTTELYDIPDTLKAVDGQGPNNVFAVGLAGSVFHYDGTSWNREDSRTNRPFTSLLIGPGVWATATDGILFRRGGDGWDDSFRVPVPLYMQGVWASGGSDVFAVGMAGTVFHYDGGDWVTVNLEEDSHLRGVDGVVTQVPTEEEPELEFKRTVFVVGAGGRVIRGPQAVPGDDQPGADE